MSACMLVKNMTFKAGQTLTVVGNIKYDPKHFTVNIGPSKDIIALHINPRFDEHRDRNTIVCNSKEEGKWGAELREKHFPFSEGEMFKIAIKFNPSEFVVTLTDGWTFRFPNRMGAQKYSVMTFLGDARIRSIEIK